MICASRRGVRYNLYLPVIVHRMDSLSTPLLLQLYYESLAQETQCIEKRLLDLCWVLLTYETALTAVLSVLNSHDPQKQPSPSESKNEIQALLSKLRNENNLLSCRLESFRAEKPQNPKESFTPGEFKQVVETYKVVCNKIADIEELRVTVKSMKKTRIKPIRQKRTKKKGRKALQEISLNAANLKK